MKHGYPMETQERESNQEQTASVLHCKPQCTGTVGRNVVEFGFISRSCKEKIVSTPEHVDALMLNATKLGREPLL